MNLTRDVRRFLTRCGQIVLLAAVLIGLIFVAIPPDSKHFYQGSLIKRNLLRTIPGSRVILVGGSNLAFGIDSEMMEGKIGMPVINDGMHVGLGVAPMEELKPYIHPGDVIIISLEYFNFIDDDAFYGNAQFTADWVEVAPERIWDLHHPILQMPSIYIVMLQHKINREIDYFLYGGTLDPIRNGYTGDKFNSHGDFTGNLIPNPPQFDIPNTIYPMNLLPDGFAYLIAFRQYAESKGAKVFFEAQASRKTNCELTGYATIKKFYIQLQKGTRIPVLTKADQLCMEDKYFFDTPNHLNAVGREIRTERLIENLKQALGLE